MGSGPGDVQELWLLNRVIRWTPPGLLYEADPRHAEQLVRDLEQFGEGAVRSALSSPGLRRDAESVEAATPLGADAVAAYRALAARANYLSLDRPDIAFAAKECCRKMAEPSSLDWAALLRLTRYLAGRPRLVYSFPWQDPGVGFQTSGTLYGSAVVVIAGVFIIFNGIVTQRPAPNWNIPSCLT